MIENITYDKLKEYFKNSKDVNINEFYRDNHYFICMYVENQANIMEFNANYITKINANNINSLTSIFPGIFNRITNVNYSTIEESVFNGKILLLIDNEIYYEIILIKKTIRTPSKSNLDPTNLFGATDGFVEDARTNLSLIRKRLKTTNLVVEEVYIGDQNKTLLYVMHLKEFDKYKEEIIKKIKTSPLKFPTSISAISKIFQGNSLMPMTAITGYPENFSTALTQGKTGIILDNSPVGLILPATLSSFSNMKNDENSPAFYSVFIRIFIIFFLILSVFGLGFMIGLINYHPDCLTISLVSNLKLTERGTNFTIFIEVVSILILFEFYRFAASRSSPSYIQNIVVILGSLFIGQNAINSGLIGPLILLITSMAYLSSYAFTNNPYMISALSNFRFFILVLSHLFGLFGFFIASFVVIAYLSSLKSFDIPYLYPLTPVSKSGIKEFFIPRSKR
ncbi:MAG: spore germination protein [Bacilli bacterium]|nr:spore germination protein [Bacilli bacterium]